MNGLPGYDTWKTTPPNYDEPSEGNFQEAFELLCEDDTLMYQFMDDKKLLDTYREWLGVTLADKAREIMEVEIENDRRDAEEAAAESRADSIRGDDCE